MSYVTNLTIFFTNKNINQDILMDCSDFGINSKMIAEMVLFIFLQ